MAAESAVKTTINYKSHPCSEKLGLGRAWQILNLMHHSEIFLEMTVTSTTKKDVKSQIMIFTILNIVKNRRHSTFIFANFRRFSL